MKIPLQKCIEFEGKKIESLELDIGSLTGNDIVRARADAMAMSVERKEDYNPMDEGNPLYYVVIAGKAAGVAPDLILALGAADYTTVLFFVKNELMGGILPT